MVKGRSLTRSLIYGALGGILGSTGMHYFALREPPPAPPATTIVEGTALPQGQVLATTGAGTLPVYVGGGGSGMKPAEDHATFPELPPRPPRRTTLEDVRRDWLIAGRLDCRVLPERPEDTQAP